MIFFIMNAIWSKPELHVEREPVPTRVLNPNASEASYKPKQRNYRKMKLERLLFCFNFSGGFWSEGFCRGDFIREPCRCVGCGIESREICFVDELHT